MGTFVIAFGEEQHKNPSAGTIKRRQAVEGRRQEYAKKKQTVSSIIIAIIIIIITII